MPDQYPLIGRLDGVDAFRQRLAELGLELPCATSVQTAPASPLAQPLTVDGMNIGNRWCIHPMEGWDGTASGLPSEHTTRRWERFGQSGAKLIWGGEAVAVRHDGRANPNQLLMADYTMAAIGELLRTLIETHRQRYGSREDLVVGLQLTHSGRFCRPNDKRQLEPRILYHHPVLDRKFGLPADYPVLTDGDIREYLDDYLVAARRAYELGFDFVDLKHCHGYLGHEFLSAYDRPGDYGGSFENRTRFLRELVTRCREEVPGLGLGVRLSAFDLVAFRPDPDYSGDDGRLGPGVPEEFAAGVPYPAFGCDRANPLAIDLTETKQLLALLDELGVHLINLTAGSPYYNPHIQRPAIYPPSDGYQPPEDPLVGCARQMQAVRELKTAFPQHCLVGTGYTYFQEYLPHVAQAAVAEGWADLVGVGRMVLSYPELPADALAHGELQKKIICRTFSDCTSAPRNGLRSGCYPLDEFYKRSDERKQLQAIKRG
ncbi:MAG: NADH:flavin oxidoreductase [Armatimonadetes bacterium]|nr:NADH:flavin oxidoreductase [Armatimonadota bacterium]